MADLSFVALRDEYARLWADMRINAGKSGAINAGARLILAGKDAYKEVEQHLGVPWWFVGIVHKMEGNCNWNTHLHNGDSLKRRTVNVPANRPLKGSPPFSWQESAEDALVMKRYHEVTDWSIEHVCYLLERYNGTGYRRYHPETLSPYLWSYSTHYTIGKYVTDGTYDASAVSGQAGAMPLLKKLIDLDSSIRFDEVPEVVAVEPVADEFRKTDAPEAVATTADLEAKGSTKARDVRVGQRVGIVTSILSGLAWARDTIVELVSKIGEQIATLVVSDPAAAKGYVNGLIGLASPLGVVLNTIKDNSLAILGLASVVGVVALGSLGRRMVADYQSGKYVPDSER